ncbi:MAG: hypothetical protein ACK4N5_22375 [Myxococcales bacterium]
MQSPTAATGRPMHSRKTYLIDRGFQLKYTVILVVVGAAVSLLFGAMMYQAHVETTQVLELPDPYKQVVAQQDSSLLWVVAGISVLMAVALGLFGVLVTHRVAGPIYVFSHYVNVLGQGRYPQLRPLRKNDELKSFFETLQVAVASMRERDRADAEALAQAAETIERAAAQSPELAEGLKAAAESIRAIGARRLEASKSEDPATPGQKAEAARSAAA